MLKQFLHKLSFPSFIRHGLVNSSAPHLLQCLVLQVLGRPGRRFIAGDRIHGLIATATIFYPLASGSKQPSTIFTMVSLVIIGQEISEGKLRPFKYGANAEDNLSKANSIGVPLKSGATTTFSNAASPIHAAISPTVGGAGFVSQ